MLSWGNDDSAPDVWRHMVMHSPFPHFLKDKNPLATRTDGFSRIKFRINRMCWMDIRGRPAPLIRSVPCLTSSTEGTKPSSVMRTIFFCSILWGDGGITIAPRGGGFLPTKGGRGSPPRGAAFRSEPNGTFRESLNGLGRSLGFFAKQYFMYPTSELLQYSRSFSSE